MMPVMDAERKLHHRRFSSEEKMNVVLRTLRGEPREALSEELNIPLERVAAWESTFLEAGREALSRRKAKWPHHGKASARIAQWSALLLVLLCVVYLLTRFMESGGQ